MNNHTDSIHSILFSSPVLKLMKDHVVTCLPEEACGVLLGQMAHGGVITVTGFVPIKNTADQPLHSFSLHPADWTRILLTEPNLIGLFHSHPHTTPEPSAMDMADLQAFGSLIRVYAIGTPSRAPNGCGLELNTYQVKISPANHRRRGLTLHPVPHASLK